MRKILYTTALIALAAGAQAQAVGINSTGVTPNSSSVLDLNTGNNFSSPNGKGLLPPNVSLTGITDNVTVASPSSSLLVYNTATANTGTLSVVPGFYYWNGTQWVRLQTSAGTANDWNLLGNTGTTAGTNFLGTSDAQDMVFKTNSVENMRIANATGNVGIGTASPLAKLHVTGGSILVSQGFDNALKTAQGGSNYHLIGTYGGWDTNTVYIAGYNASSVNPLAPSTKYVSFGGWYGNQPLFVNFTNNNIGMGTTNPTARLDIENGSTAGAIKIVDGTQGANKVLMSDANGVGTWQSPASIRPTIIGTLSSTASNVTVNSPPTYLGSYIDLPAGKWAVSVNMIINISTGVVANEGYWVRTTFCDSPTAYVVSGDFIGAFFSSGSYVGPILYGLITGTTIINNTSGAVKRYYYWKDSGVAYGSNGNGNKQLVNMGNGLWAENQIIAQPIN